MQYFELKCTAYLKQNIDFKQSFETLSKYISFCLVRSDRENLHNAKGYKYYVFGGFLPFEKDKIYKMGNTYSFSIRCLDEQLATLLENSLRHNVNNPYLQVLQTQTKQTKQHFVSELYSATPVITTVENKRYWTLQEDGDIMGLQRRLHDNLCKKYQSFYSEPLQPPQNFIQLLELKNKLPQSIITHKEGKAIRFFGNKFKIVPNEDEVSQKLAFTALACGLGEKNSFGGGFCLSGGLR